MATTTFNQRRELAHRASDGIQVTLFWNKPANRVSVEVLDSHSDEALTFEVESSSALDAFNHPYAYAATRPVRPVAAPRIPANH
jgi:hypothetical protein